MNTLASAAAVALSTAGLLTDTINLDPPTPPPRTCTVALDQTLDLVEDHPAARANYAKPGRSSLTALATDEEIERCGDLEKMVEQLEADD